MDTRTLSRYAFFIFLFLLPFQTVLLLREPFVGGEKWQYGVVAVYLTDVFVVSALVLAVYGWLKKQRVSSIKYLVSGITYGENTKYEIQDTVLILLLLWSGLSIFWASDQILASYFLVKLMLGAGVFFFARSLEDSGVRTAIRILLVAAVIQVTIATGQFLWQTSPASTLLGMSARDAWQAGTSVLKNETGRWLRAYGSFPHPNMLGGFLAATLVLSISYQVLRTKIQDTGYRMQGHVPLILILLGLILTFSRTAWLGAVIGLVALGAYAWSTKDRSLRKGLVSTFGIIAIAGAIFTLLLHETILPRFDGATIASERSLSEREISLHDAGTLIREHPFLGTGAGNFTAAIIENGQGRPIWSVQPAHDVFALILAELGIVGLILFSFFVGSVLYRSRQKENAILAIAFLTIIPSLFLDHWLWTSHFGIFLLFLLAGLAMRRRR